MTHQFKCDSLASVFADTARGYKNLCTGLMFWSGDFAMNTEGKKLCQMSVEFKDWTLPVAWSS